MDILRSEYIQTVDFLLAGAEDKDKFRNRLEPVTFYDLYLNRYQM